MSEFTSTGANLSEASNSFSFNVKDLKPASDESLGSGGASGQQPLSFSGKEPPTKEGNDGLIESSSHEEKEIHEQPAKLDSDGSVRSPKSAQCKFQAALRVQKVYRSFRTRRQLADCAVLVEQKWWKVLDLAELKRSSISFFDIGKNESALSKWSRARTKAAKVGKGLSKDEKARKLALQHWLEAIDPRHRYGHNLQFYYVKWLHCDSAQPFFYWLDIGEGKEFDLERCCRPKLHQQCIKYLGPKEREEFEVVVQNGSFMYKNSRSILDTSGSPKGLKWIFVLSTCKKLYVGQKMKGLFQHSSFLAGGATLSAGTLVVEDGFLQAVWPHSGHYLPTEENFQAFMSFLKDNDVDLTRVQKSPMEDEEESSHKKEKKKQKDNIQTEPDHGGEKEEEEEEEEEKSRASKPSKLSKLRILTKKHIIDRQKGKAKEDDSSPDGYETAEESFLSEIDFIYEKMSMFMDGEEEEEFKDAIPQETIFKRINTHRRTKSYQLGQQLSFKWATGAGPRIGCLRDYPSMLQFQAMEHVKLSPRAAVRRMGSSGSTSLKLRRDLFRLSPLPELLSPVGSVPEFHSPLSHPSELSKEEEEEE